MLFECVCAHSVDDLKDIGVGGLERLINQSQSVIVLCSDGYVESKNCMRELRAAVKSNISLTAILECEKKHGGHLEHSIDVLTDDVADARNELVQQLSRRLRVDPSFIVLEATAGSKPISPRLMTERLIAADAWYDKWSFDAEWPRGADLALALFKSDPIEWARLSPFQDVSMRLIAQSVTLVDSAVYLEGEVAMATPILPPPHNKAYHIYCSPNNSGAEELMNEMAGAHGLQLKVTTEASALGECMHALVYLNGETWTSGAVSEAFATEVECALELGVHVLLAHEMPGVGQPEARHGVDFASFFDSDSTPKRLIDAGIYNEVAVPLKGVAWREASMVLLARAVAGQDVAGQLDEEHSTSWSSWAERLSNCGLGGRAGSSSVLSVCRLCIGCCTFVFLDLCMLGAASRQRRLNEERRRLGSLDEFSLREPDMHQIEMRSPSASLRDESR